MNGLEETMDRLMDAFFYNSQLEKKDYLPTVWLTYWDEIGQEVLIKLSTLCQYLETGKLLTSGLVTLRPNNFRKVNLVFPKSGKKARVVFTLKSG